MDHIEITSLIDYLVWTRNRVLSAASHLTPEAFTTNDSVVGQDLRSVLVRQLDRERAWRKRLSGGAFPDAALEPAELPDLYTLAKRWRHEEAELRAWLRTVTDAQLRLPPPDDDDLPLWQYLVSLVLQGVAQFTVAAEVLDRLGDGPGDIGFLAFAATTRSAARGPLA